MATSPTASGCSSHAGCTSTARSWGTAGTSAPLDGGLPQAVHRAHAGPVPSRGRPDPTVAVRDEYRTNRYDESTGTLVFTDAQGAAFTAAEQHYAAFFGEDSTRYGLLARVVTDPDQVHDLTAFFAWTAWASAAERPGHDYSYTNNWPAEPRVDNGPTADLVVWSGLSLVVLLAGIGALFAVYGRWSRTIGWHSAEAPVLSFRQPGEVSLTPSQRATAWFFFVVALVFLVQATLGAASEHYRADTASFFGFDLARLLPFNLARTWHLQLYHSVVKGYFEARSLGYLTSTGNRLLEWGRLPGDVVFIVGGCLPLLWIAWLSLRHHRDGEPVHELSADTLYTHAAARAAGPEGPAQAVGTP